LIGDYAEKPRSQTRSFSQVADPPPRGEGGFLHRIFGFVDVLEQPISQPQRGPVLGPEQVGEGYAIAGPCRMDEVSLCFLKQHSLDYTCNQ
jgi:hypothetical protein